MGKLNGFFESIIIWKNVLIRDRDPKFEASKEASLWLCFLTRLRTIFLNTHGSGTDSRVSRPCLQEIRLQSIMIRGGKVFDI